MTTVDQILDQARGLSREEHVRLVKQLVEMLADAAPVSKKHSILEFEGIAARYRDDEDPQTYLNTD